MNTARSVVSNHADGGRERSRSSLRDAKIALWDDKKVVCPLCNPRVGYVWSCQHATACCCMHGRGVDVAECC